MNRRILCLSAIVVLAEASAPATSIDFTPRYEVSIADGTPMNRLTLASPGVKIRYRVGARWRVNGDTSALRLVPDDLREASAIIENAPAGLPAAFDGGGLPSYRKLAVSLMPTTVDRFETPEERIAPISINDWQSWDYTVAYVLGGRRFARSILFIKLDANREIRVTVDCREVDFAKFRSAVYASLATWLEEPA